MKSKNKSKVRKLAAVSLAVPGLMAITADSAVFNNSSSGSAGSDCYSHAEVHTAPTASFVEAYYSGSTWAKVYWGWTARSNSTRISSQHGLTWGTWYDFHSHGEQGTVNNPVTDFDVYVSASSTGGNWIGSAWADVDS